MCKVDGFVKNHRLMADRKFEAIRQCGLRNLLIKVPPTNGGPSMVPYGAVAHAVARTFSAWCGYRLPFSLARPDYVSFGQVRLRA